MDKSIELEELAGSLLEYDIQGDPFLAITGIEYDSRKVKPGNLFVAMRGMKTDGHEYVGDAIKRGAVGLVVEEDVGERSVSRIRVPNARKALAGLAARFYNNPADKLKIIGVTGTNGKTTTCHMIAEILKASGKKPGLMGTLYIKVGDETFPTNITTPESLDIHRYLARMVESGVETAVMEVSSHALYFGRVDGIKFQGAIFTNLSQDHLDFHGDMDSYFEQKKKLFGMVKPAERGGFALLNSDDAMTPRIIKSLTVPFRSYGIYRHPDIRAGDIQTDITGTSFVAESKEWDVPVHTKFMGIFNVYNALASVGAGLGLGIPPAFISKGLRDLPGVRGRFESVDKGQQFGVIVDYAHTPDGLRNVLKSAKTITKNRLILVFGCGGDRDRTKRSIMGKVAAEYADYIIITSDNPRTEDPMSIISDIRSGVEKGNMDYIIDPDRKSAIIEAVEEAKPGDVVMIAGKGHEDYQILGDKVIHFDDVEVAGEALGMKKKYD
ncbi:MAG: UDP-N-acetylmuramoyl-L-alanyl-D-glutamate--2,6-diaminopimelate ligase [Candidatus Eremiobacteraeota bacterium]|nr:UDP-N-acetylmuramoyl-L-alanyl-D-glutamate--2,6-diaminopimelate ligase [Candidatus Eremiobacteraeota bacterium]